MTYLRGFFLGIPFGIFLVAAYVFFILAKPESPEPVAGAAAWAPSPSSGTHPTPPDVTWFEVGDKQWLTATRGECRLRFGSPNGVQPDGLAAFSGCDPDDFHYQVRSVTRLPDGAVLALLEQKDPALQDYPGQPRKTVALHSWLLKPGDASWLPAGDLSLEETGLFPRLVARADGVYVVNAGNEPVSVYKNGVWSSLPRAKKRTPINWIAILALLAPAILFAASGLLLARWKKASALAVFVPGILGLGVGIALGVGGLFIFWISIFQKF